VFDNIAGNLASEYITFKIPKFGYFSKYGLIPTLEAMGMTGVFAPGADFSGMDGTDDGMPWIDQVVHKAYIQIDEYGTMAVAATGMELTLGIHNSLDARRPFIYVIRDIDTGTVLFMGRVLDPTMRQEN
jgi:serpin B